VKLQYLRRFSRGLPDSRITLVLSNPSLKLIPLARYSKAAVLAKIKSLAESVISFFSIFSPNLAFSFPSGGG
jgi:hypothetical protein